MAGEWTEYEKLVLEGLSRLDTRMTNLENGQILVRIDVAKLKVKAGLWGGIAGLVPGMIGVGLLLLSGGAPSVG